MCILQSCLLYSKGTAIRAVHKGQSPFFLELRGPWKLQIIQNYTTRAEGGPKGDGPPKKTPHLVDTTSGDTDGEFFRGAEPF